MIIPFLEAVGRPFHSALRQSKDVLILLSQTLYWVFVGPFKKKPVSQKNIFAQTVFSGIGSILIVCFVDFFIGMVLAMQSAYQLDQLGATIYVAALVGVSMTREIGPVLTSLVIAGRVGAAITAELATMKVTEQVDALRALATDPVRYLVVPRLVAGFFMLFFLTIYADCIGMLGGYLVCVFKLGISSHQYVKRTIEIFAPIMAEGRDMVQFVRGLTEIFRALLVMKVAGAAAKQTPGLLDFAPETLRELELRNEKFSKEDLLSVVYSLQNLLRDVRRSVLPELQVEATLIKLAIREDLAPLSEILQKLSGAPAQSQVRPAANAVLPKSVPAPVRETAPARSVNQTVRQDQPEQAPDSNMLKPDQAATRSLTKLASQEESVELNEVERVWAEVLERVKTQKMSCGMFLSEAAPVEVEGNLIVLGLPTELKFHKESLEKTDNKKLVEEAFQAVLASKVRVSFVITTPDKAVFNKPALSAQTEKMPDIVESALKIFDGRIITKK